MQELLAGGVAGGSTAAMSLSSASRGGASRGDSDNDSNNKGNETPSPPPEEEEDLFEEDMGGDPNDPEEWDSYPEDGRSIASTVSNFTGFTEALRTRMTNHGSARTYERGVDLLTMQAAMVHGVVTEFQAPGTRAGDERPALCLESALLRVIVPADNPRTVITAYHVYNLAGDWTVVGRDGRAPVAEGAAPPRMTFGELRADINSRTAMDTAQLGQLEEDMREDFEPYVMPYEGAPTPPALPIYHMSGSGRTISWVGLEPVLDAAGAPRLDESGRAYFRVKVASGALRATHSKAPITPGKLAAVPEGEEREEEEEEEGGEGEVETAQASGGGASADGAHSPFIDADSQEDALTLLRRRRWDARREPSCTTYGNVFLCVEVTFPAACDASRTPTTACVAVLLKDPVLNANPYSHRVRSVVLSQDLEAVGAGGRLRFTGSEADVEEATSALSKAKEHAAAALSDSRVELELEELPCEGAAEVAPLRTWRRRIITPASEGAEQEFFSSSPTVRGLIHSELVAAFKRTRLPAVQAAGLSGRMRTEAGNMDIAHLHIQLLLPLPPPVPLVGGAGAAAAAAAVLPTDFSLYMWMPERKGNKGFWQLSGDGEKYNKSSMKIGVAAWVTEALPDDAPEDLNAEFGLHASRTPSELAGSSRELVRKLLSSASADVDPATRSTRKFKPPSRTEDGLGVTSFEPFVVEDTATHQPIACPLPLEPADASGQTALPLADLTNLIEHSRPSMGKVQNLIEGVLTLETAPLGCIWGPWISDQGNGAISVEATGALENGELVYLAFDMGKKRNLTKMVSASGEGRFYEGPPSAFSPAAWAAGKYGIAPPGSYNFSATPPLKVALEGEEVNVPLGCTVRFGKGLHWEMYTVTSTPFVATIQFFGRDPYVGWRKEVQLMDPPPGFQLHANATPTNPPLPAWLFSAANAALQPDMQGLNLLHVVEGENFFGPLLLRVSNREGNNREMRWVARLPEEGGSLPPAPLPPGSASSTVGAASAAAAAARATWSSCDLLRCAESLSAGTYSPFDRDAPQSVNAAAVVAALLLPTSVYDLAELGMPALVREAVSGPSLRATSYRDKPLELSSGKLGKTALAHAMPVGYGVRVNRPAVVAELLRALSPTSRLEAARSAPAYAWEEVFSHGSKPLSQRTRQRGLLAPFTHLLRAPLRRKGEPFPSGGPSHFTAAIAEGAFESAALFVLYASAKGRVTQSHLRQEPLTSPRLLSSFLRVAIPTDASWLGALRLALAEDAAQGWAPTPDRTYTQADLDGLAGSLHASCEAFLRNLPQPPAGYVPPHLRGPMQQPQPPQQQQPQQQQPQQQQAYPLLGQTNHPQEPVQPAKPAATQVSNKYVPPGLRRGGGAAGGEGGGRGAFHGGSRGGGGEGRT